MPELLLSFSQQLIDAVSCGHSRPCSLADMNKRQRVLSYCRSFHARHSVGGFFSSTCSLAPCCFSCSSTCTVMPPVWHEPLRRLQFDPVMPSVEPESSLQISQFSFLCLYFLLIANIPLTERYGQLMVANKNKNKKCRNMSINSIQAVLLIPFASWIIHSQLELRGWSCLHSRSAFSMIHLLSYARDLLIVVYCSLPDRMLFLCRRDYSRQHSECLGNKVH